MLVCATCGSINRDLGGTVVGATVGYACGVCGQPTLKQVEIPPYAPPAGNNNAFTGAVVGGTLGGVAGGPVGAVIGIFLGGFLGNRLQN